MLAFILNGFITLVISSLLQYLRRHGTAQSQVRQWHPAATTTTTTTTTTTHWCVQVTRRFAPVHTRDPVRFWIATLQVFVRGLGDQQLVTGPLLLIVACIKYIPSADWGNLRTGFHASHFNVIAHIASMRAMDSSLREHQGLGLFRFGVVACSLLLLCLYWISMFGALVLFGVDMVITPLDELDYILMRVMLFSWTMSSVTVLLFATFSMLARFSASANAIALQDAVHVEGGTELFKWAQEFEVNQNRHQHQHQHQNQRTSTLQARTDEVAVKLWRTKLQKKRIRPRDIIGRDLVIYGALLLWDGINVFLWACFAISMASLVLDWHVAKLSNSWGFGQILPVALLLLPLFTLIENYAGMMDHGYVSFFSLLFSLVVS
jgi:hypothetical protein